MDTKNLPPQLNYLNIENLHKNYGSVKALDGVSLSAAKGEFLTFLGPSGSGKTTLLMTVAGFTMPSKGNVVLDGEDLTQIPPYDRGLGMVFQDYALFPHMKVFDNVAFPLKLRKMGSRDIKRLTNEALELVKLGDLGARAPSQLSGGQQQRVALARALVFRPRLLLMDEPLGALDKKLREEMQIELKHIQRQVGITVLSVTHDQEEALTLSDRIAVINEGRLEQIGTAHDIYEKPANRFVADFIGETNFIEGTVKSVNGDSITLTSGPIETIRLPMPDESVEAGAKMAISIRPEKISLITGENDMQCRVKGLVQEVIYMGDVTKYYIQLPDESRLVVKQHNKDSNQTPDVGDRAVVGWNQMNGIVL